jgi:DNA (cytosine-5)-methyltransferase 1
MYKPTAKGYFSGCGGMELGMMQAGVQMIQSLDLDPKATACMANNPQYFDHAVLTEDISNKLVLPQERSDIVIGTYPCTKYSTIADIHGTRTGDDLYLHFARHIMLERPEMYVLENVPGMKKFPVVMELMTRLPDYYVNVFCPVNALSWLPQQRKRMIVVGTKKPFFMQAPAIATRRPKLRDIIEKNPEYEMPDYVIARLEGNYRDMPIIVDPDDKNAVAPTCVAHYAKDLGTRMVKTNTNRWGARPFTIREYARLQGFPDDFIFPDDRSAFRLIGNAVAVPMGRWAGEQVMQYFN